jgi:hypothetical protein
MTPEENLARITEEVNEQMRKFGYILPETNQRLLAAQTGIQNFGFKVQIATGIMGNLADAVGDYTRAMYRGEKGAAVFNNSIDKMTDAAQMAAVGLSLLVPGGAIMKGVVAGLTFLATQFIKQGAELTKAANEQSDALYGAFSKLAESGAVGADGIEGLAQDFQKLGLNVNKLDRFLAVVSQSTETLARMGGTVLDGRKQFAALGQDLRQYETSLLKLGLDQDAQAEAALGYAKIQSRLALGATKDYGAMGTAAYKYIQEQDALTKVTGISRKQQEDALEEAMRNQRFAATIDQLIAEGKTEEAKQLQTGLMVARAAGKDMAAAYADMTSGMVNTDASQKGLIGSQGEMLRQINNIKAGMYKGSEEMLDAGMQEMLKKTGEFGVKMRPAAQAGVLEDFSVQYTTSMNAQTIATNNFAQTMAEARKQQAGQIANTGTILDDQAKLRKMQNDTMLEFQKFVNTGLPQATADMLRKVEGAYHDMIRKVGQDFAQAAGLGGSSRPPPPREMAPWMPPEVVERERERDRQRRADADRRQQQSNPSAQNPQPPAQNPQPPAPNPQPQNQPPSVTRPTESQSRPPSGGPRYNPMVEPPRNQRAHGTSGELGSLFEPKDIIAQLHKGERVLNKDENTDLSKLFNMVSSEKFQKKMMDTQGQMLKVIDSITSGMQVKSKSGVGNDFKSAYADISSGMMNTGPGKKALIDSQGELLKQIDSIKNGAMPALATNQSALLGDMPKLEIDKEAIAQIGQTFNEGMGEEFKSAVDNISQLAAQLKNQSGAALQQQMVGLLEDMRRSMQSTATASERLAQVASN